MKKLVFIVAFVIAIAYSHLASAQQAAPQPTVTVGQAFTVQFAHDLQHTAGFHAAIDGGTPVDVPLSAVQAGVASVSMTVAARGAHTLSVSAYNADAESPKATLAFTASLPTPKTPSDLKITLAVQVPDDGTVTFKVARVE